MNLIIDNKKVTIKEPKKVIDIIKNEDRKVIACIVDNRVKDLNFTVENDCTIELVRLNCQDGMWVYQSTLRFVICMALKKIFPQAKIKISYSVSRTLYAAISNLDIPYTPKVFNKIKNEVEKIIEADYPLVITKVTKKEAMKIYKDEGYYDKIDALQTRKKPTLHIYRCEDYYNHMFEFLMPSTGYLKSYKLSFYGNGFNISYPRYELDEKLPKFQ